MKFLLVIAMSTVLTGTAFGACSSSSPAECKTKQECDGISKEGQKFVFNESNKVKCMLQETSVATNCLENNNSSLNVSKTDAASGKDGTTGTTGTTK
ncbi:hypothetical protein DOM21_18280 [Bacteriovorax stolpii]|uniref:Uncharacterized protein n=1 Tax=Bacteriovorax stolpii TaxID=960 RepID=A0A2K9NMG6_BACTC|nr:hypothetical protein [Bacteriovorax stolpii]AUN96707.1 hypothetical protein C0V70_00995 [Bacteriovorax stolpii]QDK43362.1 hypothetical protein DOM21_18280 [Bacteriovorax stolpii]TDP53772.1 hypothetical protein C8D79_1048 [Bacteriovorax stolpii]BDT26730.1 hypothetical protein BHI3_01960 [Bacteriovorax sp. HI3]